MLRRLAAATVLLSGCLLAQSAPSRHFTFRYEFTVQNNQPGKPLRVWIPLAQSDAHQKVEIKSITGDLPLKKTQEREYGNRMLYGSTDKADKPEYHFAVEYDVVRNEYVKLNAGKPLAETAAEKPAHAERFLQPDKLVPISGLPAQIAQQEVAGHDDTLSKAQALYDYVFRTLKYDKSGTGWGRGDVMWACDAKHGNCTDFHSLFISMARSQQIPALFEIGFPLPVGKNSGEIPGYHCWAEFYAPKVGWVPVDISEAWKHPEMKTYFFGAHDVNRVQFTVGRDITLSPAQSGAPLNYFVYPYVEVDGKEYANVRNAFSFADVGETKVSQKSGR